MTEEQLKFALIAIKAHDESLRQLRIDLLAARKSLNLAPQSQEDFDWNMDFRQSLADAKTSEREKVFAAVLDNQQQLRLDSFTGDPSVSNSTLTFPE